MTAQPPLEGVRHSFVDAAGLRVHVAEAGDPAQPAVVLLHGWPQHWYCWRGVIPELAPDAHVVCPDLRGFGWSEAPRGGYSKETLARDLVATLDAMGIDRADIVGHDWGGVVGYLAAIRHPDRVRRLVAIGTGHPWPRPRPGLSALDSAWRLLPYQAAISSPLLGPRLVRRALVPAIAAGQRRSGAWSDAAASSFTRQFDDPARAAASTALYRTFLLRELPRWSAGRYADERITAPTLVLHGAGDPVLRPHLLVGLREHVDDLEVELLDGVGHFVQEEDPAGTAAHLRRFLDLRDHLRALCRLRGSLSGMSTPVQPAPCRLALCDDVNSFRAVMRIVFEFEPDIEVVGEAANGHEAIELVGREGIDVLLLDLAMPEMDGLEALPQIRRTSPDTKVIMLTGFGSAAVRARAMAAGATRYVEKGAEPTELVTIVREVHGEVSTPGG